MNPKNRYHFAFSGLGSAIYNQSISHEKPFYEQHSKNSRVLSIWTLRDKASYVLALSFN